MEIYWVDQSYKWRGEVKKVLKISVMNKLHSQFETRWISKFSSLKKLVETIASIPSMCRIHVKELLFFQECT